MENELRLKLICTKRTIYGRSWYGEDETVFNEGDVINAKLRDDGIRIEYKEKHYGLPISIREISKCFKTEYDEI